MIVKREFYHVRLENDEYLLQVSMPYLKIVDSSRKIFFKQNRIGYIFVFFTIY